MVRQGRLAAGPVVHLFLAVFLFFFFSFFFCNSLGVPFFFASKASLGDRVAAHLHTPDDPAPFFLFFLQALWHIIAYLHTCK